MKSTVKKHTRVGKNKVTVVKQHQRVHSMYAKGQHPNSKIHQFKKSSPIHTSTSAPKPTEQPRPAPNRGSIHKTPNEISDSSQGTKYNPSQFADTTRPYKSKSKLPKPPAPKSPSIKTSVHHSTWATLHKDHHKVTRARQHGRDRVKKFFDSFREGRH